MGEVLEVPARPLDPGLLSSITASRHLFQTCFNQRADQKSNNAAEAAAEARLTGSSRLISLLCKEAPKDERRLVPVMRVHV